MCDMLEITFRIDTLVGRVQNKVTKMIPEHDQSDIGFTWVHASNSQQQPRRNDLAEKMTRKN
jgi:hypothetical protein